MPCRAEVLGWQWLLTHTQTPTSWVCPCWMVCSVLCKPPTMEGGREGGVEEEERPFSSVLSLRDMLTTDTRPPEIVWEECQTQPGGLDADLPPPSAPSPPSSKLLPCPQPQKGCLCVLASLPAAFPALSQLTVNVFSSQWPAFTVSCTVRMPLSACPSHACLPCLSPGKGRRNGHVLSVSIPNSHVESSTARSQNVQACLVMGKVKWHWQWHMRLR